MNFKLKPILVVLFILTFIGACNKEDGGDKETEKIEAVDGGVVNTSEAITIKVEGYSLQEEYSVMFGTQELTAVRISEDELIFQIPLGAELGETQLVIPALSNYTVSYEIKQTLLPSGPDEVMNSFFEDSDSAISIFDSQEDVKYVEGYFNNLKEYYDGLNATDKQNMAEYYYANRGFFNTVITNELSGKSESESLLEDYRVAVVVMGASVAIAIINPEPTTKVLAVGVAILSFKKAHKKYNEFASHNIKVLDFAINDILSQYDKRNTTSKADAYLEFDDNTVREVSIINNMRTLIASDKTLEAQGFTDFFSSFDAMNIVVKKINAAITFVNDKIFFSNISLLDETVILESSSGTTLGLKPEQFEGLNFSVSDNNLTLHTVELDENNNLVIQLEINDSSKVIGEYIETQLNFSYVDQFNQLQGYFPIRVNKFGIEIQGDLDFGDVYISKSVSRTIEVVNLFNEPLVVTGISLPDGFSANWTSGTVAANSSQSISVRFDPEGEKEYRGNLTIINNLDQNSNTAEVKGVGVLSEITLTGNMAFDEVQIDGEKIIELTITNNGSEDFSLTDNLLMPDDFVPTALQTNLAAGTSQIVPIRFSPTEDKEYTGEIIVNDDLGNRITGISVSGTGIENVFFGTWEAISYDDESMGTFFTQEALICGQKQGEYAIESFQIELNKDELLVKYVENTIDYSYSYSTDSNGNPICNTIELIDTQTDAEIFNQVVPYSFESTNVIHFNLAFDNGTDIYPCAIEFQEQENGNMRIIFNTDREVPEYLYFETIKK